MIRRLLILALLCCAHPLATASTLGLHTFSAHIPQNEQHNDNFGLYYRTDFGTEAGFYRNSLDRNGAYLSQQFNLAQGKYGSLDFQIGLAYGYQQRCHTEVTHPTPAHWVETEYCKGYSRGALAPMAAFNFTAPFDIFGLKPRVQIAPALKGGHSSVIHLSLEYVL